MLIRRYVYTVMTNTLFDLIDILTAFPPFSEEVQDDDGPRLQEGTGVTIPPCPSCKQTDTNKINALKRRTHDFMGQQRSSDDDVQISYLESADTYKYDTLAISRLITCYVTIMLGRTPDSAVMTTRAGK
jgi:hypothetical protein